MLTIVCSFEVGCAVFVREYVETNADKAVEMKGTVEHLPVAVAMETHCVLRSSEQ
jgi:hypothetical protein